MKIKIPEFPKPKDLLRQEDDGTWTVDLYEDYHFWCPITIMNQGDCLIGMIGGSEDTAPIVQWTEYLRSLEKAELLKGLSLLIKELKDAYRVWVYENIIEDGMFVASKVVQ